MSPRNRSEQIRRFDPAIQWADPQDMIGGVAKSFAGVFNFTDKQIRIGNNSYLASYENIGMSSAGYLVALHELGHKLSPTQPDLNTLSWEARLFSTYTPKDRLLIVLAEIDAWQWAVEHSLTPLGADDVYMICNDCLGSYFGSSPASVMRRKVVVQSYQRLLTTIESRMVR